MWQIQPAADGIGLWLTCVCPSQVQAVVPPGVTVLEPSNTVSAHAEPRGWRVATWPRWSGSLPLIDYDAPTSVREVSTRYVLSLIDDDLAETVFQIMVDELETARQFGRPTPGRPPREEVARRGATAATWLEREIHDAFPLKALGLRLHDVGAPFPLAPWDVLPPDLQPVMVEGRACPKGDEAEKVVDGVQRAKADSRAGRAARSWACLKVRVSTWTRSGRRHPGDRAAQETTEIPALA